MVVAIEENFKDVLANIAEQDLWEPGKVDWNGRTLSKDAPAQVPIQALKGASPDGAQSLLERNIAHAFVGSAQPGKVVAVAVGVVVVEAEINSLADQFKAGSLQQRVARKEIDPHTLIHKAILENNAEVIRFLLKHGVDVDYPDETGMSPLTVAILNRCDYAVDVLLAHGANANHQVKWCDMTLLEIAFFMKDWRNAKKLVEHGVDLKSYGNHFSSLLAHAINVGCSYPVLIEIAKSMINHGAEVGALELYVAVSYANQGGDLSILELMANRGIDFNMEGNPLLFQVAVTKWGWKDEVVKFIMKTGTDVNKVGNTGHQQTDTALTTVIQYGDLNRVKFLVELGADVNLHVTHKGKSISPIKCALEAQQPEIVQYLLLQGAKA